MSAELNNILIKAFNTYKSEPKKSPVPLEDIIEFLKLEGIYLDDHIEVD